MEKTSKVLSLNRWALKENVQMSNDEPVSRMLNKDLIEKANGIHDGHEEQHAEPYPKKKVEFLNEDVDDQNALDGVPVFHA